MSEQPLSKVLPFAAAMALAAAAKVDSDRPRTESQERTNALDRAIREVKAKYPLFFKGL